MLLVLSSPSLLLLLLLLLLVSMVAGKSDDFGTARMRQFFASVNVSLTAESVRELTTLAFFVGYPRSAHSLVGSILDAHPNVVIANEFHMVARAHKLYSTAPKLYAQLVFNSARHAHVGREQAGFAYAIDGAWQGRWRAPLLVIGDKKGHGTSKYLAREWQQTLGVLQWLQHITSLRLRVFHVVRSPFDNIATMIMRAHLHGEWLTAREHRNSTAMAWNDAVFGPVVDEYLRTAAVNSRFIASSHACNQSQQAAAASSSSSSSPPPCVVARVLTVDARQLSTAPRRTLAELCAFVDVPFVEQWATACAARIFEQPYRSRDRLQWPRAVVAHVQQTLRALPHMELAAALAHSEAPT